MIRIRPRPCNYTKRPFNKKENPTDFRQWDFLHLLQTLLVSLDHLLDHLAAHGACLTGGQVAVVAIGQVDTHFPWCHFYILNPKIWGFQGGSGVIFVVFGRV